MTETIPTSEVLNRAADLIQERGWRTSGGWVFDDIDQPPGLCLEGGIQAASGIHLRYLSTDWDALLECPAYLSVASYLERDDQSLYKFNDAEGRTEAEVIEVLRACAVIEASRERESAEVSA